MRLLLPLPVLLGMLSTPIHAADCSLNLPVFDFGAYDTLSAAVTDVASTVTVSCSRSGSGTENVSYTLEASVGQGANYANRVMAQGAEQLHYNLYRNSARTKIWGDGSAGTGTITGSFKLNNAHPARSKVRTIYGRLPALQDVAAGVYNDSLVLTLVF